MRKFCVCTDGNMSCDPLHSRSAMMFDSVGEAKDQAEKTARGGMTVGVYELKETVSVPLSWGLDITTKEED